LLLLAAPAAAEPGALSIAVFEDGAFGKPVETRAGKSERYWLPTAAINIARTGVVTIWPVKVGEKVHSLATELVYELHRRDKAYVNEWKDYKLVISHWERRAEFVCQPRGRDCINIDMAAGRVTFSQAIVRDREKKLPDLLIDGVWLAKPHYEMPKEQ
jgi:hypothetical protein